MEGGREGNAVSVWEGQTSSGGLSVASTEEQHIAMVKGSTNKAVASYTGNPGPKELQGSESCRGPWQNG